MSGRIIIVVHLFVIYPKEIASCLAMTRWKDAEGSTLRVCQRPVQVHVAAIHMDNLPGGVAGTV
jgi:hypothetical protein